MDLNDTVALRVEKPKITIDKLSFHFGEKAIIMILDRNYAFISLDVELIEENCARIYNPVINPQINCPETFECPENILHISEPLALTVEITASFSEKFPKTEKIEIASSGWIRKTLICKNVEPKIINVC